MADDIVQRLRAWADWNNDSWDDYGPKPRPRGGLSDALEEAASDIERLSESLENALRLLAAHNFAVREEVRDA